MAITAEGEAVAGHDAGLDDGVLLRRERDGPDAELGEQPRPALDEEEPQQPRGHVEGRDHPHRQVQLVRDDTEERPQQGAHRKASHRDLLRPWRHPRPHRRLLRRARPRPRRRQQRLHDLYACLAFRPHLFPLCLPPI